VRHVVLGLPPSQPFRCRHRSLDEQPRDRALADPIDYGDDNAALDEDDRVSAV
jgi:hypothetical protein